MQLAAVITPVPGDLKPSSGLQRHCVNVVQRCTCSNNHCPTPSSKISEKAALHCFEQSGCALAELERGSCFHTDGSREPSDLQEDLEQHHWWSSAILRGMRKFSEMLSSQAEGIWDVLVLAGQIKRLCWKYMWKCWYLSGNDSSL